MSRVSFILYLITDRGLSKGRSLEQTIGAALSQAKPGEVAVQLREKDLPPRELLPLAQRLTEIVHRQGGWLLVNDRADLAMAAGADGVHLGGTSMPAEAVRRVFPGAMIGASTHSAEEAESATAGGADFIVTGPVHKTASKPGIEKVMGTGGLRQVCTAAGVPVFALGGMNGGNAREAVQAGALGIACMSAVMNASDPGLAVRCILDAIRSGATSR